MKNLLIVDDQPGIRLLLCEVFQREGYTTHLAANGHAALQLVEEVKPDCVLLDMEMHGMNGTEVLKQLKAKWPEIPVIMMTANDVELTDAIMKDVVHYFTKPFDIYLVCEAVNELFIK